MNHFPKRKFREIVFQLVYAQDLNQGTEHVGEDMFPSAETILEQAYQKAKEIKAVLPKIDEWITSASNEYGLNRITSVERNAIRLGLYEIAFDETIPPKVAISEAIRITRKYGSPEGGSFVNAILDQVQKNLAQ